MVEACDRVLAPHGSMCIELGDTYAGSGGAGGDYADGHFRDGQEVYDGSESRSRKTGKFTNEQYAGFNPIPSRRPAIIPQHGTGWPLAKSLSLIPELFRLTLVYGTNPLTGRTTDQWRLRNVVRWVRPNPPVGALGDKFRPATSELMVFCKSAKRFFDLDSVRVPYKQPERIGKTEDNGRGAEYPTDVGSNWSNRPNFTREDRGGAPPLDWWNIPFEQMWWCVAHKQRVRQLPICDLGGLDDCQVVERLLVPVPEEGVPLDWWNIPPGGYEGAHYAVFPPELCIKPIKAMCPERVCRQCGEPSRRITEVDYVTDPKRPGRLGRTSGRQTSNDSNVRGINHPDTRQMLLVSQTTGWSDCDHNDWRPGVVLDPFVGSGTTLMVATGHGRDAIGIDLDSRNFDLALERVGPFILERGET